MMMQQPLPSHPLPQGNFDPNYAQPIPVQQQEQGIYFVQPPPIIFVNPGQPRPLVARRLDPIEILNIFIRVVALAMTFIATCITGAAKELKRNNNWYSYGDILTTANLSSFSPIKYFLAANSIVLIYTVATLVISIFSLLTNNQQQQKRQDTLRNKLIMLFVAGDLVAVAFLFSAVGSSAGIKDALNTNSDIPVEKFCSDGEFGRNLMCAQWTAGIVMSTLGGIAYVILQLLSVFTLTKVNAAANNNSSIDNNNNNNIDYNNNNNIDNNNNN